MSKVIKLKKGLDINLVGEATENVSNFSSDYYAIKPSDFPTLVPHMEVKVGDKVQAGSVLFTDKNNPEICFASPVSGVVEDVVRAERRRITHVIVKADSSIDYKKIEVKNSTQDEVVKTLLSSGVWPYIKQRPFNVIADSKQLPKAIYISCFNSAPLSENYQFTLKDEVENIQVAISNLSKVAKVYVGLNGKLSNDIFKGLKNCEINSFEGPHPAGNAGVQISHVCPVNKGEIVWVINPSDAAIIGKVFSKGIYDASKTVALTGSKLVNKGYAKLINGAKLDKLVNLEGGEVRLISGNVLTGTQIAKDEFLGFYDNQITAIPEGNYYDFFGWALPGVKKYSVSRTFFSWLTPKKQYDLDTNLHGEQRAYVVTGCFEKLLPMDILPLQLIKAILANDIEKMENLGIYEVAEEDFALCEFADTSKTEIQSIIRGGLNLMIAETK